MRDVHQAYRKYGSHADVISVDYDWKDCTVSEVAGAVFSEVKIGAH